MSQFSGVYPILYAFYDRRGRLDDGLMRLQVEKCIAAGAQGIAVRGQADDARLGLAQGLSRLFLFIH